MNEQQDFGKFVGRQLKENPIRFLVVCGLTVALGFIFSDVLDEVIK